MRMLRVVSGRLVWGDCRPLGTSSLHEFGVLGGDVKNSRRALGMGAAAKNRRQADAQYQERALAHGRFSPWHQFTPNGAGIICDLSQPIR